MELPFLLIFTRGERPLWGQMFGRDRERPDPGTGTPETETARPPRCNGSKHGGASRIQSTDHVIGVWERRIGSSVQARAPCGGDFFTRPGGHSHLGDKCRDAESGTPLQ
ncbi:hypothetical protein GCM10017557_07580 [Streptomyces aurantiacus]|uniref:Uncharacterized protein n=1 Tax=Streptomyces aurantiacus TaxID=47760 RepID=A0A7G1NSS0_9ACTN|nr:hypothetical protein GCM10017557_07580 [Streptomyces aurantiacus]